MTKEQLESEAYKFRQAIEKARAAGSFRPYDHRPERMNNFPHDCCDDTADLFTHYLFHKFGIDSIRVDGEYFDKIYGHCGHSWQETEGWIIDLTGDQFENDSSISVKAGPVYVGKMDGFHRQFKIFRNEHSCGIECLGDRCQDRMYDLYGKIIKNIE